MAYEQIKYEVEDQLLTITLNRPDKLNAYTHTMQSEMIDAFDRADQDNNIRAIIVTGAEPAFCAGADLSEGGRTFDLAARADRKATPRRTNGEVEWSDDAVRDDGGRLTLRIFKSLKPVIAAVNGSAVGIGVTMQLAMDIRIAADNARFGFVFSRRGIVPEACSSWFLPRIVGIAPGAGVDLFGSRVSGARGARRPPGQSRGPSRSTAADRARTCPRDCRQRGASVGRFDPADDVAHARRRRSHGGAQNRQPRYVFPRRLRRCARGRDGIPGEAAGRVHRQGV
jgi:enoyl-CoA hydratase/carnithine racemase